MKSEKDKYSKIENLLPRFCEGQATNLEVRLVEEWMAEDESHRKTIAQIQSLYLATETLNTLITVDTEKALEKIQKEIWNSEQPHAIKKPAKQYAFIKWLPIVASFALLLAFSYFYFQQDKHEDDFLKIAQDMRSLDIEDESTEVSLILSDKKKIEVNNNAQIIYSSNGQVSVNTNKLEKQTGEVTYNQVIVPKGRRSQIILADNSKIWINSGSRIVYPTLFKGKYREIFVEGEAYLEVAHNADIPFIVKTSGFDVQVLGTSFNVSAYKGVADASVVLVNGSVNIKDKEKHQIMMAPNERVELIQNAISTKKTVNVADYISWVKGIWTLKGEPLGKIVKQLEIYYGIKIYCDPSVADNQIYGELFLNDDINQVMKSIISALPLNVRIEDNIISIEP